MSRAYPLKYTRRQAFFISFWLKLLLDFQIKLTKIKVVINYNHSKVIKSIGGFPFEKKIIPRPKN